MLPQHNSFCTIEYLSPLKYNISGTCYTSPIPLDNLVLITCPGSKSLVKADSLNKCFKQDNMLLCPHQVLHPATATDWLGMPWTTNSRISFARNQKQATHSSNLHPLLHLNLVDEHTSLPPAANYSSQQEHSHDLSPLTIYNFPCNVSFSGMPIGISDCTDRLESPYPCLHWIKFSMFPGQLKEMEHY